MGHVNPESMKDWKDGEIVMAADYKQERELLRVAINDNFDRLIKKFIAVNRNGSVKTTTDLNTALNELRFREGDNVILSMDKDTATLTISVEYSQGSVDTPALKDGSVVRAKIANGAVHVEKIADGAVTESKIANNAVTTSKIANNSVTNAKIASNAVTNAKIANQSVSTEKIADGAVTTSKIANNSVTNAKIANQSVSTEKIQTGALDGRYYTKQEVNAQLAQKTDRTGDHQGTWHGLRVEDIDPEGFDAARITALEKKLNESDVRDIQLNRGLQIVEADESSPLHLIKVEGKTVINILPNFNNWTVEQPSYVNIDKQTKMTVQPFGNTVAHIGISVKKGAWYTVFGKVKDPSLQASLDVLSPHGIAKLNHYMQSSIFQAPNDSSSVLITISGSSSSESVFEDICIVEGIHTDLDFVAGMKNLRGLYVKRYGKNILPPFNEWTISSYSYAQTYLISPYELKFTRNTAGNIATIATIDIPIMPNTTYTLNLDTPDGAGKIVYTTLDSDGNGLTNHLGATQPKVFTTEHNAAYVRVRVQDRGDAGTITLKNPTLNLGSEPIPFEPQNSDYLFADVELASNANAKDVLEYRDGRYWKVKRFNQVVLDGRWGWTHAGSFSGYRTIRIPKGSGFAQDREWSDAGVVGVKYDGIVLNVDNASLSPDTIGIGIWMNPDDPNNEFLLSVKNEDTGWASDVNPNSNAVKALMNGWKATANNGTVYTAWESILNPSETSTDEDYVANYKADGWTGWATLQYRLADSVVEDVTDKVEGAISLHDGDNLVEMGEAVVVREVASPFVETDDFVYINTLNSPLNLLSDSILRVYKDGLVDSNWMIVVRNAADPVRNLRGNDWARIPASMFDPSATYTVTYIAEPWQLSSSVQSVDVQYGANVKTALDRVIQDASYLKTVVSEIPNKYAKRVQENWIEATLLSGFSGNIRYFKDSFGIVHIVGSVYGGDTSQGNVLFVLPKGYRPNFNVWLPAWSGYALGAQTAITLELDHKDGRVKFFSQTKDDHIFINTTIRAGV